jgi:hypothetical protein
LSNETRDLFAWYKTITIKPSLRYWL